MVRKLDKLILEITANGRELLYWHAEPEEVKPIPDAAEAALLPEEIKTTEQPLSDRLTLGTVQTRHIQSRRILRRSIAL